MAEQGRYLYAVCRGLPAGALDAVLGLSEAVLDRVEVRDLTAVVSAVDLAEYGEDGLRRNLERIDWLETAARGHDAVVEAAAAVAPTAPLRLATIFRSDEAVRERLTVQYDAISAVLDRVEGHEEWSVKVLTRASASTAPGEEAFSSGADYLRHRREERDERRLDVREAHVVAERVHDVLVARASASRRLPPQDARLTGHTGTMVHNVAYLVSASESDAFVAAAGEQADAHGGVVIDTRGPWPPYSFAMLDDT